MALLADETAADLPADAPRRAWRTDAAIALVLVVLAGLLRRHFPTDGLFYDDAWQALGAVKGSLGDLPVVGQTQPTFTLELMTWARLGGGGDTGLVVPALIAGALAPGALYLVLRKLGTARSISILLGAALATAPVHIIYSGRVKSYTTDVLVVLGLALAVGRIARARWTRRSAVAWVIASVLIGTFSSFTLLAAVAAGLILVLHPQGDRRLRIAAVGVQLAVLAAFSLAVSRSYNARLVVGFFRGKDGFLEVRNPIAMAREVVAHLLRVVFVYPGVDGPRIWLGVVLVVATVGLFLVAWRGPYAVSGRFLVLSVLMAMAASVVGIAPFGPLSDPPISGGGRVTLWLIPAIAIGLAASLERARRALRSVTVARVAFDVIAGALAVALLLSAVGGGRAYPPAGGRGGTEYVMAHLQDDDAVWITRPTSFSFALYADQPFHLRATPKRAIGFLPELDDDRFRVLPDFALDARALQGSAAEADRVWVIHANADPSSRVQQEYRIKIAIELKAAGFEVARTEQIGATVVDLWRRAPQS